MKKLLLLSISAMMSLGAMAQVTEPTLTKVWEKTTDMPAIANARWGAACDGKFYLNERTVGVYSYSAENGDKETVSGLNVGGTGFNFDGAGNALFSNQFAGGTAMTDLVLWNATTKETKKIAISDDFLTTLGFTKKRMDYIGRGAGNIFSAEGGAFFFAGGTVKVDEVETYKVLKLYITNGELDQAKTKVLDSPTTVDTGTIAIALSNDPSSDDYAYRYRGAKDFQYFNGSKWLAYGRPEGSNVSSTNGGDIVELSGVLYTIEPAGTNYYDGWQVVDRKTNKIVASVAEHTDDTYKCGNYTTVLSAEKVSETIANIYHYHNGQYVTMHKFEVPEAEIEDDPTAIESVEAAAGAVEYYNLQGVKVANPENGLFIKKQGNKATKVVL